MNILSVPAPASYLDDCEMVDAGIRVIKCGAGSFPQWLKDRFMEETDWKDINELAFFYSPSADAVVLNRDPPHYDLYELLVTTYLNAGEEIRQQIKDNMPTESFGDALEILDIILEERSGKCQTLNTIS